MVSVKLSEFILIIAAALLFVIIMSFQLGYNIGYATCAERSIAYLQSHPFR